MLLKREELQQYMIPSFNFWGGEGMLCSAQEGGFIVKRNRGLVVCVCKLKQVSSLIGGRMDL